MEHTACGWGGGRGENHICLLVARFMLVWDLHHFEVPCHWKVGRDNGRSVPDDDHRQIHASAAVANRVTMPERCDFPLYSVHVT